MNTTKAKLQFSRDWVVPFLLILLGVILVYEPVLMHCYAHTDDYPSIYNFHYYPGRPFEPFFLKDGRPLMGLYSWFAFKGIAQPEQLWKVRSAGLLAIAACALLLYHLYRKKMAAGFEALCMALVLVFTPAFGVYAGWATESNVPLAILTALIGGWMALPAEGAPTNTKLRTAVAVACIWLSECNYQPAAGFFLLPAIVQASRPGFGAHDLKTLRRCILLFLTVLAVYYVAYQACVKLFFARMPGVGRGALCADPLGRLKFLLSVILPRLFTSWSVFSSQAWRWVVGLFVLCLAGLGWFGWLWHCEKGKKTQVAALVVFCFLLVLSPVLVAKDDYAPFRTLAPAYALVLHFAILGCVVARAGVPGAAGKWMMISALCVGALGCGIAARYWVWHGLVAPNERELTRYRHYLEKAAVFPPQRIYFSYPAVPLSAFSGMNPVDEYGLYSSWLEWVPKPMLTMILCEEFGDSLEQAVRKSPDKPELILVQGETTISNKTDLVVDGTRVLNGLMPPARIPKLQAHAK